MYQRKTSPSRRGLGIPCAGTTKDGEPCKSPRLKWRDFCQHHDPKFARANHPKKWQAPREPLEGVWSSKLSDLLISRGYTHPSGRFTGKANLYRLAKETGIQYSVINDVANNKVEDRLGMDTLGKLCGFLGCGPSDLIEWLPGPKPPKPPAPITDEDGEEYIPLGEWRAQRGEGV